MQAGSGGQFFLRNLQPGAQPTHSLPHRNAQVARHGLNGLDLNTIGLHTKVCITGAAE
jgi:hypothetical protein